MKGDFSRIRFNPARQYTAVLEQQGRVALDADANEQASILDFLRRTANIDVIGPYGGPEEDAGFAISIQNGEILIGRGRYYVQGLLAESAAVTPYDQQAYLLNPSAGSQELLEQLVASKGTASVQLFLEVWQRLVTPLDDPCLREPALGQADTTARLQTVSRVVARLVKPASSSKASLAAGVLADTRMASIAADSAAPGPSTSASTDSSPVLAQYAAEVSRVQTLLKTSMPAASQPIALAGQNTPLQPAQAAASPIAQAATPLTLASQGSAAALTEAQAAAVSQSSSTQASSSQSSSSQSSSSQSSAPTQPAASVPAPTPAAAPIPIPLPVVQPPAPTCCQSMYALTERGSTGALRASLAPAGDECGCEPVSTAGYRGLENQLYRVEIHTSGTLASATFKWSRENASVVAAVESIQGKVVRVSTLGPDANLGFQPGQWVELSDDSNLFGPTPNQPGALCQIESIQPSVPSVTMAAPVAFQPGRNSRMRRWEQSGASATPAGIPLSAAPTVLENGIEVSFQPGEYLSGDFWTIPARTATGDISWPPCGSDGKLFQPPSFSQVYSAPLACIHLRTTAVREATASLASSLSSNSDGSFQIDDCRHLFPPLTQLSATQSTALHVTRTSWANDDTVTLDALLAQGLSLVFDQAPDSPWTGGNFQVVLEVPGNPLAAQLTSFTADALSARTPFGAFRQVIVLDPPAGITINGNTVNWLTPLSGLLETQRTLFFFFEVLNQLLLTGAQAGVFGRVRIRLLAEAIFKSSPSGAIYLDGSSFGSAASTSTGTRIDLAVPSGDSRRAADFQGWFYLAPTVLVSSVTVTPSAVTVNVNGNGVMTGLTANGQAVSAVEAAITLNYAPASATIVTLVLTGTTGVGSVASIQASVTIPAGSLSVQVPVSINRSPGVGVTDTFNLAASLTTGTGVSGSSPVSFTVTGGPLPIPIVR